MTNQAAIFFNNAELSLASYALFPDIESPTSTQGYIPQLVVAGMSQTEAEKFAFRYPTIVSSIPDQLSGFSATVFREKDTGQLTVAIRGTLGGSDLAEDTVLTGRGAAYSQIVDMFNWWQRVTNTGMVNQYEIVTMDDNYSPLAGEAYLYPNADGGDFYLVKKNQAAASGELANEADKNSVDVTGHSLGGHLASAFTALFSTQVDKTYTYNGPGFINSSTNRGFFAALEDVAFANAVTPFSVNVVDKVTRIQANDGLPGHGQIEAISNLHNGTPGTLLQVAIEDKGFLAGDLGTGNHSIIPLTASLAVFNLLSKFDSSLSIDTYNAIFQLGSNTTNASLESVVDSLQAMLNVDHNTLPTGNGVTQREAFYQAIYSLLGTQDQPPAYAALLGNATIYSSLGTISPAQASTDFGAFLSLYYLAPLTIHANAAATAALQNTDAGLYADWSAGKFDNTYLTDRAAALSALTNRNYTDLHSNNPNTGDAVFVDYATSQTFFAQGGGAGMDTYVFDASDDFYATIDDNDNNGGSIKIGALDLSTLQLKEFIKNPDATPTPTSSGAAIYKISTDGADNITLAYNNATRQATLTYRNGGITGVMPTQTQTAWSKAA